MFYRVTKGHMELQIKISLDGSNTIYVPSLNEHYHSTNGAITEAIHVYRHEGLEHYMSENPNCKQINVLEIGFGTGLNALVTALNTGLNQIYYEGIELFPLPSNTIAQLNYGKVLGETSNLIFEKITESVWNQTNQITPYLTLNKVNTSLFNWNSQKQFQVIYFDAFGPEVQPEMWTAEVFEKISNSTQQGGVLTTYCAKGEVRRQLQRVGFKVYRIPGPPGKREMVRAVKL